MAHRTRRLVTSLVAIAATLGFVGVSAALEGEDPTLGEPEVVTCPDPSGDAVDDSAATDGTSDTPDEGTVTDEASDEAAVDEPTGTDDETTDTPDACTPPEVDDTDDVTEAVDEVADEDGAEEPSAQSSEVDNHGAAVSQAAHDCPPGPEHGPCVRDVAHSDAGKPAKGGDESTEDDAVEDESTDADGDDSASDAVVEEESTSAGKGHGGGKHGH